MWLLSGDESEEAIAKAMESGTFGLGEGANADARIALFLNGDEKINGPGGLKEQIEAKAYWFKALGGWKLPVSGDDVCAALSMELEELEEKRGILRVAMQEVTRCLDALTYATRLKRQRS